MSSSDDDVVSQKKSGADLVSWREYEALRDDVWREFRKQGEELNEDIQTVTKKLDTTNETVNTIQHPLLMSVVVGVVLDMVSLVFVLPPSEPAVFPHNRKTMVWPRYGLHTYGGKGHIKRDCPNRKVMIVNEDNVYETGDDADLDAPEDDDYDSDGFDAFPFEARTIVVSQRALKLQPSASTQHCNLFQTKALVGPDKACKVTIDGGSSHNLASKELCAKLKLKYVDRESITRGGEEQLDMVMDVKTSHGRASEEREACAKEGEGGLKTGSTSGRLGATPGAVGLCIG
ncbi:hypothetical protein QYE76_066637 [Lolium multiflorum]|uniref:Uncharacterized protein n=1 Tax=Lolium multiflorum TaxID=4521 RepID=A0AAD8SB05_LOLMU|nr:hypothetical protein QYE76_066637 [Lolium multiflorum]